MAMETFTPLTGYVGNFTIWDADRGASSERTVRVDLVGVFTYPLEAEVASQYAFAVQGDLVFGPVSAFDIAEAPEDFLPLIPGVMSSNHRAYFNGIERVK